MTCALDTRELKNLLPADIEACLSERADAAENRLPDAERQAAATMNARRRSEFAHGRACARAVLAALGLPEHAIPVGASREPVWPDGIVGSITHCGGVAAAVAGRRDAIGGIGIDMEVAEPLDDSTLELVCCAEELAWLRSSREDARACAKLLFSAKESIFKCIWPTIRRFVDFRDIVIQFDAETGTFAPAQWSDGLPAAVIGAVAGRYAIRDRWIMTAASLPPVPG